MARLSETLLLGLMTYETWRDELETFEAETGVYTGFNRHNSDLAAPYKTGVDTPQRSPYPNDL